MRRLLLVCTIACGDASEEGQRCYEGRSFVDFSAGGEHVCGIETNGASFCCGDDRAGQSSVPPDPLRQISAGFAHTCGVRLDGTLVCWGSGVPPDDVALPAGAYVDLASTPSFAGYSCAVRDTGAVSCWGANYDEMLDATPGLFARVTTGGNHACALRSDGTVACWGFDLYGQATPPAQTFVELSAGGEHTCGIETDGSIACWGAGWGVPNDFGFDQTNGPTGSFTKISAGTFHNCALASDQTLRCWGAGSSTTGVDQPHLGQAIAPPGRFLDVSAGDRHTCAITETGTVECWGAGRDPSRCENVGFTGFHHVECGQAAPPPGSFVQVSSGRSHSCALRADGEVTCWGAGTETNCLPRNIQCGQSLPKPGPFVRVSAGVTSTCGLRPDGSIDCWGYFDPKHFLGVPAPPGEFESVSAGFRHSCAIRVDGTLACWGEDAFSWEPPAGTFVEVSAGSRATCALRADGDAVCWGQWLSDDTTTVELEGPFVDVITELDRSFGCGMRADGTTACTHQEELRPQLVLGETAVQGTYACTLLLDGRLLCRGFLEPFDRGERFSLVTTGISFICGLRTDGTVVCSEGFVER